jgi:DNA-binding NtrC family response regulator
MKNAKEDRHSILLVDDDPKYLKLLESALSREGNKIQCASSGEDALDRLNNFHPDLILLDVIMPRMTGFDVCLHLHNSSRFKDIPIIFLTSRDSPGDIIKGLKIGAVDYITKPFSVQELVARVNTHLELKRKQDIILEMNRQLKKEIEERELAEMALHKSKEKIKGLEQELEASLEEALGRSSAVKPLYSRIRQVASSQFSLILYGETGVGKSYLARIIHKLSNRSQKPFVVVDIGSIPESLVESELFGHKKGAFTGATEDRKGFFEKAHNGTIFLDELENLSLYVQSKLLLAADEKRILPLGSRVQVQVDVRIIAAANENLEEEVRQGRFRQDLFYRLNDFSIHIPPLRERREDICALASGFLIEAALELCKNIPELSPEALEFLENQPWPGNIRELKSVIRRAVLFCSKDTIFAEDIAQAMNINENKNFSPQKEHSISIPALTMEELEKWGIQQALHRTQGNKMEAASMLKIGYSTLKRKMIKYDIKG